MSDSASPPFSIADIDVVMGEFPPNIVAIDAVFDVRRKMRTSGRAVFFAYGKLIYNPCRAQIPQQIIVHEATHCIQQQRFGMTTERWWDQYLASNQFRLEQEIEGHRNEYEQAVKMNPCRQSRRFHLKEIASRLSGPLYNRMISLDQAKKELLAA